MTPAQFIAKWQAVNLSERSACQQHFLDLCELLGQPKPAEADPEGAWYCFEKGVKKTAGGPPPKSSNSPAPRAAPGRGTSSQEK